MHYWPSPTVEKSLGIERNMGSLRFKFCLIESPCVWAVAPWPIWQSPRLSCVAKVYRGNADTRMNGQEAQGLCKYLETHQTWQPWLSMEPSDRWTCAEACHLHRSSGAGELLEPLSLASTSSVICIIQTYCIIYNAFSVIFVGMIYLNLKVHVHEPTIVNICLHSLA